MQKVNKISTGTINVSIPIIINSKPVLEGHDEVGSFYWTDLVPDIVNAGREGQDSVSV